MSGDHQRDRASAIKTKRAKILAVFVVDTDETKLTIPDK
ncbi:Mg-chelatase subunit ChlD [Ensifer sp. 4252]